MCYRMERFVSKQPCPPGTCAQAKEYLRRCPVDPIEEEEDEEDDWEMGGEARGD